MTTGIRTGSKGPPEDVARARFRIPARPDPDELKGIIGEIGRQRDDPELETLLRHMVDAWFRQLDPIWEALDILDKRYDEHDPDDIHQDTEFTEVGRSTQRRERVVESDDGDIVITLLDVVTQDVSLKGNKTGKIVKYKFQEPLPV